MVKKSSWAVHLPGITVQEWNDLMESPEAMEQYRTEVHEDQAAQVTAWGNTHVEKAHNGITLRSQTRTIVFYCPIDGPKWVQKLAGTEAVRLKDEQQRIVEVNEDGIMLRVHLKSNIGFYPPWHTTYETGRVRYQASERDGGVEVTAETETYASALPMGWALRGPMENVIARQQQRSASGFLEMSRKICTAFAREQGRLSPDSEGADRILTSRSSSLLSAANPTRFLRRKSNGSGSSSRSSLGQRSLPRSSASFRRSFSDDNLPLPQPEEHDNGLPSHASLPNIDMANGEATDLRSVSIPESPELGVGVIARLPVQPQIMRVRSSNAANVLANRLPDELRSELSERAAPAPTMFSRGVPPLDLGALKVGPKAADMPSAGSGLLATPPGDRVTRISRRLFSPMDDDALDKYSSHGDAPTAQGAKDRDEHRRDSGGTEYADANGDAGDISSNVSSDAEAGGDEIDRLVRDHRASLGGSHRPAPASVPSTASTGRRSPRLRRSASDRSLVRERTRASPSAVGGALTLEGKASPFAERSPFWSPFNRVQRVDADSPALATPENPTLRAPGIRDPEGGKGSLDEPPVVEDSAQQLHSSLGQLQGGRWLGAGDQHSPAGGLSPALKGQIEVPVRVVLRPGTLSDSRQRQPVQTPVSEIQPAHLEDAKKPTDLFKSTSFVKSSGHGENRLLQAPGSAAQVFMVGGAQAEQNARVSVERKQNEGEVGRNVPAAVTRASMERMQTMSSHDTSSSGPVSLPQPSHRAAEAARVLLGGAPGGPPPPTGVPHTQEPEVQYAGGGSAAPGPAQPSPYFTHNPSPPGSLYNSQNLAGSPSWYPPYPPGYSNFYYPHGMPLPPPPAGPYGGYPGYPGAPLGPQFLPPPSSTQRPNSPDSADETVMSFSRGRRASSDLRVSGEWVRNVVQDAERAAAAAERAAAAATEALNRSQQPAMVEAPKKKEKSRLKRMFSWLKLGKAKKEAPQPSHAEAAGHGHGLPALNEDAEFDDDYCPTCGRPSLDIPRGSSINYAARRQAWRRMSLDANHPSLSS